MKNITLPNGASGVDTDVTITVDVAKALLAAGKTFVIRSIGHTAAYLKDNLSSEELMMLTDAGLAVGVYRLWRTGDWSAETGGSDGDDTVVQLNACGYLQGGFVAVDLEGNSMGPDVAAYTVAWASKVRTAGFSPWVYVGPGCPLNAAALAALAPSIDGYWQAGAIVPQPEGHDWGLMQSRTLGTKIDGAAFDLDSTPTTGSTPSFVGHDGWIPIVLPVEVPTKDPNEPINALPLVPGEEPADRIIRIVKSYDGCSLSSRRADLGELVSRGVDKPEAVVGIATNCATSALGIMAKAGVKHKLLNTPYVSGMAVGWVRQIAMDRDALVRYSTSGPQPKPGALLRYNTAGTNNDHVEWVLGPVGAGGMALHGGGGRGNNAISVGMGDIRTSWGRPIVEWIDPDKLGIDFIPAPVVVPDPEPAPIVAPPGDPVQAVEPQIPAGPIVVAPKDAGDLGSVPAWKAIWNFLVLLFKLLTGKKT